MAGHDDGLVQRHNDRFVKVEDRLGHLEVSMATVIVELDAVKGAVTNFKSLDRNVTEFITTYQAHELDVEKTRIAATNAVHDALIASDSKRGSRKMIFDIVIAILMLILTAMMVHREWKDSRIQQPRITAPKTTGQTYNAHNNPPQDAASYFPTVR